MGKNRRRAGRSATGQGAASSGQGAGVAAQGPAAAMDKETKALLEGIDSRSPQGRASACDSLEAALVMGSSERRGAVASRVFSSGAFARVVLLLSDPFPEVATAAASAIRALADAGGPAACETLAAASPAADPGAPAGRPRPSAGLLRLALIKEACLALAQLARGSHTAVDALVQSVKRGDVAWPSEPDLPLAGLAGPLLAMVELPLQAEAAGQWSTGAGASGATARDAVLAAQEAAANAFHTLSDEN
ncbi:hypothetical protein FNF27_02897 [Cafeteria roenbergensis]|uniref:Uncharacterized protein n=1 Tax=Cafeteria roenbergensis TaxID=33653 RepID=A0A5A8EJ40_CAFRO|nr:hypothetical protein FNF27_02897 [Cafeteria roenbergensis]